MHSLPTANRRFCVHKPCPPERQFSLQSLKHAPDSLSCPVRKKHKLGTMTTTPKHLYPFIQHSVNVYCEPDITSGCVPAVPDLTVIHTRMFLECCFSAWLYQGFLSFPGGNRLDRMKSKSLQTWHTHGRPRLAHAASSTAQLPFYAPVAHLWFPPPLPLASTCLGPILSVIVFSLSISSNTNQPSRPSSAEPSSQSNQQLFQRILISSSLE